MTEIELKAHLDEPEQTLQNVKSFALFQKETEKLDSYWSSERSKMRVRLREEKEACDESDVTEDQGTTVTYKKKEIRDSCEINEEIEFIISNRKGFENFISDAGFVPQQEKIKQTKSYMYISNEGTKGEIPITIEISLVKKLGWFIELEILVENPDELFIQRAQELLKEVLAMCKVPQSAIEKRYYTEMLSSIAAST